MALSPFGDKAHRPDPSELRAVLGVSSRLWDQLILEVAENHQPIEEAWNFGGINFGWSLRLKRKDRTILYLIPQVGHFLVGVVLGEKVVKTARQCGLPRSIIELIDNARAYAEGCGIRIPVTKPEDLAVVQKLAAAKMSS